jgi:hypothetical protein
MDVCPTPPFHKYKTPEMTHHETGHFLPGPGTYLPRVRWYVQHLGTQHRNSMTTQLQPHIHIHHAIDTHIHFRLLLSIPVPHVQQQHEEYFMTEKREKKNRK